MTDIPVSAIPTKCTIVRARPMKNPANFSIPFFAVAPNTTRTMMKFSTISVISPAKMLPSTPFRS